LCPTSASQFHRDAIAHGQPYSPMSPSTPSENVIDADFRRN
jgi:hypothetical protein